eukprot:284942_1
MSLVIQSNRDKRFTKMNNLGRQDQHYTIEVYRKIAREEKVRVSRKINNVVLKSTKSKWRRRTIYTIKFQSRLTYKFMTQILNSDTPNKRNHAIKHLQNISLDSEIDIAAMNDILDAMEKLIRDDIKTMKKNRKWIQRSASDI